MPSKRRTSAGALKWVVIAIWGAIALSGLALVGAMSSSETASESDTFSKNDILVPTLTMFLSAIQQATDTQMPNTMPPAVVPSATLGATYTPSPTPLPTQTSVEFSSGAIVIGSSVQGRPIEVYRFGTGERVVMIVGGIHGGYEANTVALAEQLIAYAQYDPAVVPEDTTLYILPVLNPDGLQYMHKAIGRGNANHVDLNRNWTVGWSETWSRAGCWDLLPINSGPYPASEPETLALMGFIIHNPLVALVSYHAAAPGIYPAEDPFLPKSEWLAEDLSKASGYPYPAIYMGCQMTGTLVDWVASTGAAAVDVELTDHYNTDYGQNLELLIALLNWRR